MNKLRNMCMTRWALMMRMNWQGRRASRLSQRRCARPSELLTQRRTDTRGHSCAFTKDVDELSQRVATCKSTSENTPVKNLTSALTAQKFSLRAAFWAVIWRTSTSMRRNRTNEFPWLKSTKNIHRTSQRTHSWGPKEAFRLLTKLCKLSSFLQLSDRFYDSINLHQSHWSKMSRPVQIEFLINQFYPKPTVFLIHT